MLFGEYMFISQMLGYQQENKYRHHCIFLF